MTVFQVTYCFVKMWKTIAMTNDLSFYSNGLQQIAACRICQCSLKDWNFGQNGVKYEGD